MTVRPAIGPILNPLATKFAAIAMIAIMQAVQMRVITKRAMESLRQELTCTQVGRAHAFNKIST